MAGDEVYDDDVTSVPLDWDAYGPNWTTLRPPREPECAQCGTRRRRGEFGKWWPTGAWSCRLCYEADFA